MASLKIQINILFSVKGSLKQCIWKSNFSEQFVNYIKLNSEYRILMEYRLLHLYLQWMNEWHFGLAIMAVYSHVDKVTLLRPRLVLRVWDAWPFTGIQPRYVTNCLADSASYPQWEGK